MDVVLKVLEGAKHGAKIAVKKSEFTIGRAQECSLCAGSTAVSRKHCLITRDENRVTVQDLGSRNGTLINGEKTEGAVELKSGDELTVGPLKFLVTISTGIANEKKPQVKSVAEAVNRAASDSSTIDVDDISQWLLGPAGNDASAGAETQTIMMDDTNAGKVTTPAPIEVPEQPAEESAEESHESEEHAEEDKGKKKGPGKLPTMPAKPGTKDSREAAMEALRNWNRRR